jgi:hypothetical protein
MKNRLCAPAVIAMLVLSSTALAQIVRPIRFALPQVATVGAVALPAGECDIESIQTETSASTLVIRCGEVVTVASAMRVSRADGRPSSRTEVVLRHHDGKLEVHQVWVAGEAYGYELLAQ